MRLVTLGEGVEDTRRRVPRAELASLIANHPPRITDQQPLPIDDSAPNHSSAMDVVIERYGRARLLSFDRDPITREPRRSRWHTRRCCASGAVCAPGWMPAAPTCACSAYW